MNDVFMALAELLSLCVISVFGLVVLAQAWPA
jgi:hypothetical protein